MLDLQAVSISEHKGNVITVQSGGKFLPVCAIYGPNGGGKSNLLEAFYAINRKVLQPVCALRGALKFGEPIKTIAIRPFAFLPDEADKPTEFRITFMTQQADYDYMIHIKEEKIVYENLKKKSIKGGKWTRIFERIGNKIDHDMSFAHGIIGEEISEILPLLSYLGIVCGNMNDVSDVIQWFEDGIDFLHYGDPIHELNTPLPASDELRQLTRDMLREMDLGINDIRVEKVAGQTEIYLKHTVNGHSIELPYENESGGIRKILGMVPLLLRSRIWGSTLVIDEMDAKLHPELIRYIIELYTDVKERNKSGAQLIFTSHDLTTMSNELLRRDEIWLMEKGELQDSRIRRLSEIKNGKEETVRKDAKFDKQYLEGKYGALPGIKKIG